MSTALIFTIRSMRAYETWGWEFRIIFACSGVVFYPNRQRSDTGTKIGEADRVRTFRCRSNSMRFSSGRPAIPDAEDAEVDGRSSI